MAKQINFEEQLGDGSAKLLSQLEAALGVKGKTAILKLLKSDPEARRLAEKIIGAGSPAGIKAALNPAAADIGAGARSPKKAQVEF